MNQYFGLESFLAVGGCGSCEEVAVVVAHWCLASHGLLCVGLGEDFTTVQERSEILPQNWKEDGSVFCFKYQDNKRANYILKVIPVDNSLIMSIMAVKTETSHDLTIIPKDYIKLDTDVAFTNLDELINKIKSELVEMVIGKEESATGEKNPEVSSSSTKDQEKKVPGPDPLLVGGRGGRVDPGMPGWGGGVGAPPLGGSDLDPMGGIMGGGMLMDPRQGGRMGHPMQPRFDPVGPGMGGGIGPRGGGMGPMGGGIGPMRGGGRNYGDAMRPPDWDNMYM